VSSDDDLATLNAGACPTVESLDAIGTQWRLNVLYALQDGEQRFNALKESTGASSRTLSQTLETLQEHDLVERRSEEASPIAVYYRLTPKGEALESVFDALETWAEEHHDTDAGADSPADRDADTSVGRGVDSSADSGGDIRVGPGVETETR
jgi:DNA-binding HxlR family transcriptional regulator